jgi:hypothetical protein
VQHLRVRIETVIATIEDIKEMSGFFALQAGERFSYVQEVIIEDSIGCTESMIAEMIGDPEGITDPIFGKLFLGSKNIRHLA